MADKIVWSEERWRRALEMAAARWIPTLNPAVKCGFCMETLDGGRREALRNAQDHPVGDCAICPIKKFCDDSGTHDSPNKSPEVIGRIQEHLRGLCEEHGVAIPGGL
jgi:hypothetical protein